MTVLVQLFLLNLFGCCMFASGFVCAVLTPISEDVAMGSNDYIHCVTAQIYIVCHFLSNEAALGVRCLPDLRIIFAAMKNIVVDGMWSEGGGLSAAVTQLKLAWGEACLDLAPLGIVFTVSSLACGLCQLLRMDDNRRALLLWRCGRWWCARWWCAGSFRRGSHTGSIPSTEEKPGVLSVSTRSPATEEKHAAQSRSRNDGCPPADGGGRDDAASPGRTVDVPADDDPGFASFVHVLEWCFMITENLLFFAFIAGMTTGKAMVAV